MCPEQQREVVISYNGLLGCADRNDVKYTEYFPAGQFGEDRFDFLSKCMRSLQGARLGSISGEYEYLETPVGRA